MSDKKFYFVSDVHLGTPTPEKSLEREKKLVQWLSQIQDDAQEIYFLGDIFDFWYEWKHAVPRGFVRFLGKLAELSDKGIPIHFFKGNHDVWYFDYLQKEFNITVHDFMYRTTLLGKTFLMAHGDGIGKGDYGLKFLRKLFRNRVAQYLFSKIHPNISIGFASWWSKGSRKKEKKDKNFRGHENEWLVQFSRQVLEKEHIDFFMYGHRHLPTMYPLNEKSTYINTGDWLSSFTYVVFDNQGIRLEIF